MKIGRPKTLILRVFMRNYENKTLVLLDFDCYKMFVD